MCKDALIARARSQRLIANAWTNDRFRVRDRVGAMTVMGAQQPVQSSLSIWPVHPKEPTIGHAVPIAEKGRVRRFPPARPDNRWCAWLADVQLHCCPGIYVF